MSRHLPLRAPLLQLCVTQKPSHLLSGHRTHQRPNKQEEAASLTWAMQRGVDSCGAPGMGAYHGRNPEGLVMFSPVRPLRGMIGTHEVTKFSLYPASMSIVLTLTRMRSKRLWLGGRQETHQGSEGLREGREQGAFTSVSCPWSRKSGCGIIGHRGEKRRESGSQSIPMR